jgi:hypothetical protein
MACSKRLRSQLNSGASAGGTWEYLGYHPTNIASVSTLNIPTNPIIVTDANTDDPLINPTNASSGYYKWKYTVTPLTGSCPTAFTEINLEIKNTCAGGPWSMTRCSNSPDLIQLLPQFIVNTTCGANVSSTSMTSSPSTIAFNSTDKTFLPSAATTGVYNITNSGTVIPSVNYAINTPCDECVDSAIGTVTIVQYRSSGTTSACTNCDCTSFPGSTFSLRTCLTGEDNGGKWMYTNNTGVEIRLSYVSDGSYLDIVPNGNTWTYQSPSNNSTMDIRITGAGVAAPAGNYTFTYIQNENQPCQNQSIVVISLVAPPSAGAACAASIQVCNTCDNLVSGFFNGLQTPGGVYTISLLGTQTRSILVNGVNFNIGNGVTKVLNATDQVRFIQLALNNYRISYVVQSQGCATCTRSLFVNIGLQLAPPTITAIVPVINLTIGGATYDLNSNFIIGNFASNNSQVFYTITYNNTTIYTDPYPTGFTISNTFQTGTFNPSTLGVIPGTYTIQRCHNYSNTPLTCFPACETCATQCAQYNIVVTGNCGVSVTPFSTTACVGSTVTLTGTTTGSGTCTLQWETSPNGTSGWATIGGATTLTYNPPTSSAGTLYYRLLRNCSAGCTSSISTPVSVTIVNPSISITASQNTTCIGGAVTLNATTSNTLGCLLSWQTSINNSDWTTIVGQTASSYIVPTGTLGSIYYRAVYNCNSLGGCTTLNSASQQITVVAQPSITITRTPVNGIIGIGGAAELLAAPVGGTGTCTVKWQSGPSSNGPWTDIPGATNNLYVAPTASIGTIHYRVLRECTGGNGACITASATTSITVNTQPSVSITSNSQSNTGCTGATIILTANTANSSGNCTISWKRRLVGDTPWSASLGTGAIYNVNTSVASAYEYQATYTCDCAGCDPALSNIITVTIFAQPSVTILPTSASAIINQVIGALTGTGVGGTGTCTYQWQSSTNESTWTSINGATSNTFTPPTTTLGILYYRLLYSCNGANCSPATSNTATITITNPSTVSVSPLSGTVCQNGVLTLTVTASGGVGTCGLQWQSSVNSSTWSNISGQTATTYTVPTSTLGQMFYRVRYSCSLSGDVFSDSVPVTVVTQPQVVIATSPADVCVNATVTLTAQPTNGTAGCTYQWKSGVASNSLSNIGGATSSTYTPVTSALGTLFYSVVYSCPSLNCSNVESPVRSLTVYATPTVSISPISVNACVGNPQLLTAVVSGGAGGCGYQWQSSTTGNAPWTDIPSATSATYNVLNTTPGTYYYRVRYRCLGSGCGDVFSNNSQFLVSTPPSITLSGGNVTGCINDVITLTATPGNGNGTCEIVWQSSNDNTTWNLISGASGTTFTVPTAGIGISYYRARYECQNYTVCTAPTAVTPSQSVTITGCFQASIASANQSVTYTREIRSANENTLNAVSIEPQDDSIEILMTGNMVVYANYPVSNTLIDTQAFSSVVNDVSIWSISVRIGYAGIVLSNGGFISEMKVYKSDDPNTSILVILHNGTSFNYLTGFYGTVTAPQLTFNTASAITYRTALETQIKNALSTIPTTSSSNYSLFVSAASNGLIGISFTIKHNPAASWIGINRDDSGRWVKYNSNGVSTLSETNGITYIKDTSSYAGLTYNDPSNLLLCGNALNANMTPANTPNFYTTASNFNNLVLTPTMALNINGTASTTITKKLLTVNASNCNGTLTYLWNPGSQTTSTKLACTGSGINSCQVTCSDPNSQQTPQITI